MEYIPRENEGEGYGVAFFPILEVIGQAPVESIAFPTSLTLETELCTALRAALPTSTVAADEFEDNWDEDRAPPVSGDSCAVD